MGMYTELIFGASLKVDTPTEVINALIYMIDEIEKKPTDFPLSKSRLFKGLFNGSSYYFGVNRSVSKMWFEETTQDWKLSIRSNIKNYDNEIETFLKWIKPYIDEGSGRRNMYAIVTHELGEPTIYFLDTEDESFKNVESDAV